MTARTMVRENLFLGAGKSHRIDFTQTEFPAFVFGRKTEEESLFRVNYSLWGSSRKLITRLFNGVLESFLQGFFIEHYLEDELIDDYYHSYDFDDPNGFHSLIIRPVTSLRRILDIGYHEKTPHIVTLRSDFTSVSHSVFIRDNHLEIEAEFKNEAVLNGGVA